MATSSPATDLWLALAEGAAAEHALWADSLLPAGERARDLVFSPLAEARYALGVETIYEGYLVHYGRPRLFAPQDRDTALLLGDYLYAHGLVRIAETGHVDAVAALAELISACAALRAAGAAGDGEEWVRATRRLGGRGGEREVERALLAHARRLD